MEKILIGIPITNDLAMHTDCKRSLDSVCGYSGDFSIEIKTSQSAIIAVGRNVVISSSMETWQSDFDFDYFLSCDADIEFTIEHVKKLYELCHKHDIVSGIYEQRGDVLMANAGTWETVGLNGDSSFMMGDTGIKKADWFGAGFFMASKSVFAKMPYPWFNYPVIRQGTQSFMCGEDIGFCINAANSGIELYADCDCKIKHLI